jgi:hypothetical protein
MEQNFDLIYLFKPEGTEDGPSIKWIYYRVTPSAREDDGHIAVSRVTFPGCVDISDNPGDLASILPGLVGYESAEAKRNAYLLNRWGVDHNRSILIGSMDSSPSRLTA